MAVLIAELVGFALMIWVIYRYVVPPLGAMVTNRQEAIQHQVEEAEAAAERYAAAERRLESAVADARAEAARLRDDARADATLIREELTEQAHREVERLRRRGEEQLAAQREQLVRRLRAELGRQAMTLAERLVVQSLSDGASRSASVDTFLDDVEELVGRTATPAAAGRGSN